MKKLRCTSCNGELELDEKKEYGKCKFCGTTYKLNDDMTINIKIDADELIKPAKASFKLILPVLGVMLIFSVIFIFLVVKMFDSKDVSKEQFNIYYSHSNGTQQALFVESTLDHVNDSNKKYANHQITVVYNDITTTEEDKINEIKRSLTDNDLLKIKSFEVKIEYDKKGYVERIIIEDIK